MIKILSKYIKFCIIIFIVAISIILLIPHTQSEKVLKHSKQLIPNVSVDNDVERVDYLDENGNIQLAADVGYATMITKKRGTCAIEYYYDEKGNPIRKYAGYSAMLREYDERGRVYHISYLDEYEKPIIVLYGYSDKYYTFYDNGKIKTEKYYNAIGDPICTQLYGYGILYEYKENNEEIITYLNDKDESMMTGLGYAKVIIYNLISDNLRKAKSEFYFDKEDAPIALELGQYGIYKEYNEEGMESVITYLDAKGYPIKTTRGYTTIKKTYHANNYLATEMYYDIEGHPISLAEGQFGIKKEEGQIKYLDQNGNEQFNLKRFLYNASWIIVPCAIIIIILSVLGERWLNCFLCVFYLLIIIYLTLMFRENAESKISEMFAHYRRFFDDRQIRIDIIRNIWLFVPFGSILFCLYPHKTILFVPVFVSIMIECFQLIAGIGLCEIDDVISNVLGGCGGYYYGKTLSKFRSKHDKN